jgi:hypothetical protein
MLCFRILFEIIQGEMTYVRDLENIAVVRVSHRLFVEHDLMSRFRCTSTPYGR